jgi:hypothetical protein
MLTNKNRKYLSKPILNISIAMILRQWQPCISILRSLKTLLWYWYSETVSTTNRRKIYRARQHVS